MPSRHIYLNDAKERLYVKNISNSFSPETNKNFNFFFHINKTICLKKKIIFVASKRMKEVINCIYTAQIPKSLL